MADVEKILNLVAEGKLSAQEADEILAALAARDDRAGGRPPAPDDVRTGASPADEPAAAGGPARHVRIEISEKGRSRVNLRLPINLARFAAPYVKGLPDEVTEQMQASLRAGTRGTLVDITDDDGDRVLIVSE
jgi:hypothetical protein